MARKEPAKGIHTSPDKAGKFFNDEILPKDVENDGLMNDLLEIYDIGSKNSKAYKGLWTEELLEKAINDCLKYCAEHNIKPSKSTMRLWLGVSKSQYYDWETKPEKYGYKSELVVRANEFMECQLINRIEKYPTGNTFLLKTSHGHIEANKLDITTNGNDINSADEVKDLVSKLGLEKK